MNIQNNKTHKKTTALHHKHSYRKLRRWVLPAVLGAALSTLAFLKYHYLSESSGRQPLGKNW